MDWSLFCGDGLITFILEMSDKREDKSVQGLHIERVLDALTDDTYETEVNKKDILLIEEKLGIKLRTFVDAVLFGIKIVEENIKNI